jgi:hypothetical protein
MARDCTPAQRDPASRRPRFTGRSRPPVPIAAVGAVLAVYAWVEGSAVPFSRGAFFGVLIPGAVLAVIAWRRPPERIPAPQELDLIGASYWVICLTAFLEWEASAWRDNSWPWHPSFTNLISPMLGPHLLKSAAILVWILAGWALVRR